MNVLCLDVCLSTIYMPGARGPHRARAGLCGTGVTVVTATMWVLRGDPRSSGNHSAAFSLMYFFTFSFLSFFFCLCATTACPTFFFFVCVCGVHMEVTGQLAEVHVGPRGGTQLVGLSGRNLYPLSYVTGLIYFLSVPFFQNTVV